MSISEQEQQVLDDMEDDLTGSGPELAAKLAMFTRLTAGEEMPPRECVRHPVHAPSAGVAKVSAEPETARIRRRLRRRTAWRLSLLVLTIAFIALAIAVSHGGGNNACPASWAACRQAHPSVPAQSGTGGGP